MIRFSEFVSPGHPDKIADFISQYILDKYIEIDPNTRYAVEVQIKNNIVTLGGEVSSKAKFRDKELTTFVKDAVNWIGYTREYQEKWGADNTICGEDLTVNTLICQQSQDIAQGLDGWGDQGIFFGYASGQNPEDFGLSHEHAVAKRLCKALFDSGIGGLDIKTQVIVDEDEITKVIVAIPLLEDKDTSKVKDFVRAIVPGDYALIVNGTGRYVKHSSIADCGTTGRKLVVDFYGGASRIGGGSPWTKDGSKADLTLNLYARYLAKLAAKQHKCDCFVSLACCIGQQEVDFSICDQDDNIIQEGKMLLKPSELSKGFHLDLPIYASMCLWGLFGEYQQDKQWEKA